MYELKSTPRRYQNPEVFEQLAMEYAVGSMQGRARIRFEALMETHFYLRATVDAYEAKFSSLVGLLPDSEPSNQVWNNIEAHIKQSEEAKAPKKEKTPWLQTNFFKQSFGMAAAALIVVAALNFSPDNQNKFDPTAIASYHAPMEYDMDGNEIAMTKIKKSEMMLSINIMKPMEMEDGMELALWCQLKDGSKPMKMGTISKSGMTELKISEKDWKSLKHVASLQVTVEKENKEITEPTGRVILKGKLSPIIES